MSVLSLIKPIVGKPDATEDVKLVNALTAIENWANGNIGGSNLLEAAEILGTQIKNGTISEANLSTAVKVALAERAGLLSQKSIIATEQSRENAAYGTLATPDEVTVTLPENGMIAVVFQAAWQESVAKAARAALFIGANQLKVPLVSVGPVPVAAATAATEANKYAPLFSAPQGLLSAFPSGVTTGDVTTGQAVGLVSSGVGKEINGSVTETEEPAAGGVCYIFAAAGTYKVTVQYKASSGKVTAKARKLWAWVVA